MRDSERERDGDREGGHRFLRGKKTNIQKGLSYRKHKSSVPDP